MQIVHLLYSLFLIGKNEDALRISKYLMEKGIYCPAIRPPTVPEGKARLRLTITALHEKDEIDFMVLNLTNSLQFFNPQRKNRDFKFLIFLHFGFVSDFDIRFSDFIEFPFMMSFRT